MKGQNHSMICLINLNNFNDLEEHINNITLSQLTIQYLKPIKSLHEHWGCFALTHMTLTYTNHICFSAQCYSWYHAQIRSLTLCKTIDMLYVLLWTSNTVFIPNDVIFPDYNKFSKLYSFDDRFLLIKLYHDN